jgi:hypothetical protein
MDTRHSSSFLPQYCYAFGLEKNAAIEACFGCFLDCFGLRLALGLAWLLFRLAVCDALGGHDASWLVTIGAGANSSNSTKSGSCSVGTVGKLVGRLGSVAATEALKNDWIVLGAEKRRFCSLISTGLGASTVKGMCFLHSKGG